jgi:hypothetical protein
MQSTPSCPSCGNELRQKSRAMLFVAGLIALAATVGCFFLSPIYWIATSFLVLIGGFLIAWSTFGKGLWCRQCKKFPVL